MAKTLDAPQAFCPNKINFDYKSSKKTLDIKILIQYNIKVN